VTSALDFSFDTDSPVRIYLAANGHSIINDRITWCCSSRRARSEKAHLGVSVRGPIWRGIPRACLSNGMGARG
jgi:hypothetical protein